MQPIIRFTEVSKRYYLGSGVHSLRSALANIPKRILGHQLDDDPVHWALKNVSFEVKPGTSLGLLGHNGAGKTTILKLLSGITQATSGTVEVNGRVASLIELGAGFHPEMTGRENVYMNAAILGMTRGEVNRQFDSIVDFAEIEEYLDTPVKRYSSGMYVRLAFAIAAHLEPEILLVDEVLAVGDINFRVKCYRRMADLRSNGTTIVFVSHNINQVRETCQQGLLLWQGDLLEDAPVDDAITAYLRMMQNQTANSDAKGSMSDINVGKVSNLASIQNIRFLDQQGRTTESVVAGESLSVEISYHADRAIPNLVAHVDFYRDGSIFSGYSTEYNEIQFASPDGDGRILLTIEALQLPPGNYYTSVVIAAGTSQKILAVQHHNHSIEVIRRPNTRGEITLPHNWEHEGIVKSGETARRSNGY